MKVSLNWLKDYVDIKLPPAELANKLTMAGLEVKSMEVTGGGWQGVYVAKLIGVNPHPNADRLRLATVDLGASQETVVCGAPNLTVGDKVAFAKVGSEMIDPHTGKKEVLKPAKIRGVLSAGMVVSEAELGISDNHEGILVLPPDAPVGEPLAQYLGDTIMNVEVTPNRPDCLSVIGIAREIAALTGQTVKMPDVKYPENSTPVGQDVSVEITDASLCPRYTCSVIKDVVIKDSPPWMQQRLAASGQRPINNVVDVTNYVMLEYGQPLHSFDYDKIHGKKIIVRRARQGETIITLDDVPRELTEENLLITDADRAVALAGVMGGANTEVTESTGNILLESASFNPASIHFTARTLRLQSEASQRFERGIRADISILALRRATQLIIETGGRTSDSGVVDEFPGRKAPEEVKLTEHEVTRILGTSVTMDEIKQNLGMLGFEIKPGQSPDEIVVTPPYWRSDVHLAVDLIEDVARIAGYDRIPLTMISGPTPQHNTDPMIGLKRKIRISLADIGFQELVTYSLVSLDSLARLYPDLTLGSVVEGLARETLKLYNPMSPEQEYLRTSLRPNLLAALAANRRYEEDGIRLFEVGRVYVPRKDELPDERETLCVVLAGTRTEKSWRGDTRTMDFYYAKGTLERLLREFGITAEFSKLNEEHDVMVIGGHEHSLHPAERSLIMIGDKPVGVIGAIHPRVLANFDINEPAYLFEIDLPAFLPFVTQLRLYRPIPRFQAVERDIALILDAAVTNKQVLDVLSGFSLVTEVKLFDVYSGGQVPAGKKSLAYRLTFQSPNHTLKEEEVNGVLKGILSKLGKALGAVLRG